jgi:hypothetical protein
MPWPLYSQGLRTSGTHWIGDQMHPRASLDMVVWGKNTIIAPTGKYTCKISCGKEVTDQIIYQGKIIIQAALKELLQKTEFSHESDLTKTEVTE